MRRLTPIYTIYQSRARLAHDLMGGMWVFDSLIGLGTLLYRCLVERLTILKIGLECHDMLCVYVSRGTFSAPGCDKRPLTAKFLHPLRRHSSKLTKILLFERHSISHSVNKPTKRMNGRPGSRKFYWCYKTRAKVWQESIDIGWVVYKSDWMQLY